MSAPAINTVTWFEVASDDPDGAQRFYGELFGWDFVADPDLRSAGMDYRLIRYQGGEAFKGAILGTEGDRPNHAVFVVLVADVSATCEQVERLGGKVVTKVVGNSSGPDFAYLQDISGNVFSVFAPRPAN
ncbi:VOC family protein [Thermopolyspora sp. NPDC052614]|uniref:VOC family protein n=1 Tax=Thermopolyspora sp. NPDC052614 TaxID=3155682 RepID=UPI003443337B